MLQFCFFWITITFVQVMPMKVHFSLVAPNGFLTCDLLRDHYAKSQSFVLLCEANDKIGNHCFIRMVFKFLFHSQVLMISISHAEALIEENAWRSLWERHTTVPSQRPDHVLVHFEKIRETLGKIRGDFEKLFRVGKFGICRKKSRFPETPGPEANLVMVDRA